jgi:hypothetical protein
LGDGIGWKTFLHSYRSWMDDTGAAMSAQKELMRHANVSYEYGPGLKWYPLRNNHRIWLVAEGLRIVKSPVSSVITPYNSGFTGWAPATSMDVQLLIRRDSESNREQAGSKRGYYFQNNPTISKRPRPSWRHS